ncbi:MAG: GrpB family protein [Clostridia bacterium]|jgi:GrpB-like predicted nucleotidyltransferase (UPF0157 family)|nr:GrpB family protein [Clostridia bacterium]MCI1999159.1 GrpB family protein [Clostridia bacterium]MCI2014888.1 GrpB family protein [Clostridia bacterium]
MEKELSEMTLEELWELFPIILKEHNPEYKNWYEIEKKELLSCIEKKDIIRINHIGSTYVKGLIAKPTVDILLEIDTKTNIKQLTDTLIFNGWTLMMSQSNPFFEIAFNKGYTKKGFAEKVYHLHIRYFGDWDELYFRDYLIKYPEIANEYGRLKLRLKNRYEHDRDGYTNAKTEFVSKYSKKAKEEFKNRYKLPNK